MRLCDEEEAEVMSPLRSITLSDFLLIHSLSVQIRAGYR